MFKVRTNREKGAHEEDEYGVNTNMSQVYASLLHNWHLACRCDGLLTLPFIGFVSKHNSLGHRNRN